MGGSSANKKRQGGNPYSKVNEDPYDEENLSNPLIGVNVKQKVKVIET